MNTKKKKMDKLTLFLIPIGVAINFVGGQIAGNLGSPVYLDSIGTISVGALCGGFPGALVGLVSNLVNSISYPLTICYAPISIILGFLASVFSKRGYFRHIVKVIGVMIIFGIIAGGISAITTWLVYGFDFGVPPTSYISLPLYKIFHLPKFVCEFIASACIDIFDKSISIVVMLGIFKAIPKRMLTKLPLGNVYLNKKSEYDDEI